MVIELYGPDGQKTKLWTKLAEWTALGQWYREIDKMLLYSVYNKNSMGTVTLKGENSRPVYHGAGLRQQISPANKRTYYKLTYELLDNFLLDLSYNANRWEVTTAQHLQVRWVCVSFLMLSLKDKIL